MMHRYPAPILPEGGNPDQGDWVRSIRQVVLHTNRANNAMQQQEQHNCANVTLNTREGMQMEIEARMIGQWKEAKVQNQWWYTVSKWSESAGHLLLLIASLMAFVASIYPSQAVMFTTGCVSVLSASLLKYSLFATQQMTQAYTEMRGFVEYADLRMPPPRVNPVMPTPSPTTPPVLLTL